MPHSRASLDTLKNSAMNEDYKFAQPQPLVHQNLDLKPLEQKFYKSFQISNKSSPIGLKIVGLLLKIILTIILLPFIALTLGFLKMRALYIDTKLKFSKPYKEVLIIDLFSKNPQLPRLTELYTSVRPTKQSLKRPPNAAKMVKEYEQYKSPVKNRNYNKSTIVPHNDLDSFLNNNKKQFAKVVFAGHGNGRTIEHDITPEKIALMIQKISNKGVILNKNTGKASIELFSCLSAFSGHNNSNIVKKQASQDIHQDYNTSFLGQVAKELHRLKLSQNIQIKGYDGVLVYNFFSHTKFTKLTSDSDRFFIDLSSIIHDIRNNKINFKDLVGVSQRLYNILPQKTKDAVTLNEFRSIFNNDPNKFFIKMSSILHNHILSESYGQLFNSDNIPIHGGKVRYQIEDNNLKMTKPILGQSYLNDADNNVQKPNISKYTSVNHTTPHASSFERTY